MSGRRRLRWGRIFIVLLVVCGGFWALHHYFGIGDNRITIALDAGHGGEDPGAVGVIAEIDMTEPTVRYLEEYLGQDDNYRVVLCRDYGEGKDLNDRWKKAVIQRADLLLCIHGNSSEDSQANGFEIYPPLPDRKYHTQSVEFAEIVAEQIQPTGIQLRGNNGIRYAYYQEDAQGNMQKVLVDTPDANLSDCKSFAMVEYPRCPAVLIEQCFLTNSADVELLGDDAGCRTAAEAYYRAICTYFGTQPVI